MKIKTKQQQAKTLALRAGQIAMESLQTAVKRIS